MKQEQKEIERLKEENEKLKEENETLWFMLEEQKNSQDSIGQALESMLKEALADEMLKNMEPVGDA
jgi:cell division septum initiation protein DivIVA